MGGKINGKRINEISYADDKVILAEKKMIDQNNSAELTYGMKISAGKTKVIKFTRNDDNEVKIKIGTQEIENVNQFRYLRALIDNDGRDQKEIKCIQ